MTLRQEIEEELTYLPINKTGDYECISNNIIKLIEKRIDSIYIKHPNLAGIAHNECLDQIKREMLK